MSAHRSNFQMYFDIFTSNLGVADTLLSTHKTIIPQGFVMELFSLTLLWMGGRFVPAAFLRWAILLEIVEPHGDQTPPSLCLVADFDSEGRNQHPTRQRERILTFKVHSAKQPIQFRVNHGATFCFHSVAEWNCCITHVNLLAIVEHLCYSGTLYLSSRVRKCKSSILRRKQQFIIQNIAYVTNIIYIYTNIINESRWKLCYSYFLFCKYIPGNNCWY